MSDVAIRVENLSKLYRIGGKQEKYATLRDTIVDMIAAPYRRVHGLLHGEAASDLSEEIWALKDINFEVKHGEVVGIIGRNGAGKSTLLKILSRITEPTIGYADVYGRIGALLEVGTGFHPELTGRENVYLNGAILGMSREDIKRKFDAIVDFAGVEKFIDTPVKHYSSGMGLRLGFAVAAHLEPEILIIDEVLAVGDAEFQKKCMGKMSEVAGEGRTVLFVSHNMAAIRTLCTQGVVLKQGIIDFMGDVGQALLRYHERAFREEPSHTVNSRTRGVSFSGLVINNSESRTLRIDEPIRASFDLHLHETVASYSLFVLLKNSDNELVVHSRFESNQLNVEVELGRYHVVVEYPPLWLRPGIYSLQLKLIAGKLGSNARYVSDTEMLSVVGDVYPASLLGSLTPECTVSIGRVDP